MTKDEYRENWVCGDCGAEWSPDVDFCKNKEMDKLAVKKYAEGYTQGLRNAKVATSELVKAIKVINSFGLGVSSIEDK